MKKAKKVKKVIKKKIKKVKSSRKIWEPKFKEMKNKIDKALKKLKSDIEKKQPIEMIEQDNNELLLLLGQCNYLVREFHEHATS
jgi:hypothetical protein